MILLEPNKYESFKYLSWIELQETKFFKFLAICFQIGIEKRPNIKDYWPTRAMISMSFASKHMSRNRFVEILNSLHFADNATVDQSNRLSYHYNAEQNFF